MNESVDSDVFCLTPVCINQLCRYLKLILRRPAGTEVKAQQVIREARQPLSHLLREARHRQCIIFEYHYPAILLTGPLDSAPMIPVRAMLTLIYEKVCVKQVCQLFGLVPA
jgi:hypothetical protein